MESLFYYTTLSGKMQEENFKEAANSVVKDNQQQRKAIRCISCVDGI